MNTTALLERDDIKKHSLLIKESYERVCGKPFPVNHSEQSLTTALYCCDHVIVSHGMEKDPVFNYANLKAQALWGMDWETFTRLPSRLSAKPDKVETRETALKEALAKGYISNYEGIRVDATGKEFCIRNVLLWNLIDANGIQHGQAAMFDTWEYL